MKKQFIKPEIKLTDMDAQQIMAGSNGIKGAKGGNVFLNYGGNTASQSNFQVD